MPWESAHRSGTVRPSRFPSAHPPKCALLPCASCPYAGRVIERIGSLAATGSSVTPWLIVAGVVVLLGVIALVIAGIVRSRRAERQVQDAAEPDAGAGPSAPVEPGSPVEPSSPVGPGGPVEPSSPVDDGGAENPQTHQQPRDPTQADDGPLK